MVKCVLSRALRSGEPRAVERERRAHAAGTSRGCRSVITTVMKLVVVHAQQLEALDGHAAFALGDRIGRDNRRWRMPSARPARSCCPRRTFLSCERFVDLLRFRLGDLAPLHQLVDIQPVALGGRHAAGGGVRLLEVAQIGTARQAHCARWRRKRSRPSPARWPSSRPARRRQCNPRSHA